MVPAAAAHVFGGGDVAAGESPTPRHSGRRRRSLRAWLHVAAAVAAAAAAAAATATPSSTSSSSSPPLLGRELVASFRERGHALTRGVLNQSEIGPIADMLPALLREHSRRAFAEGDGQKEVRFTFAVHELNEQVAAFVTQPGGPLWRMAKELAGGAELCLLMDRGFSKDPGDKETHWHRDDEAIYLPTRHPDLRSVHAWIPLTPMGREMGTLKYLFGTHVREPSWIVRTLASLWGWEFAWYMTSTQFQDDEFRLGDIAWHDGWILHSAGANGGGAVRDGLAASFAYCASGAKGCGGGALRRSDDDMTCRVSASLFDEKWLASHRAGEEDYVKTALLEPLHIRVGRFVFRSAVGALLGLLLHFMLSRRPSTSTSTESEKAEAATATMSASKPKGE